MENCQNLNGKGSSYVTHILFIKRYLIMSRPTGALISVQTKPKTKKKCTETSPLCVSLLEYWLRWHNSSSKKKKKKIVVLLFTHQRQQGGWVRDVGGSRAHSLGGTFEIKFLLNFCQYSLSFFSFLFFISTHHHLCVQYNKRIESLGKRKYSGVDLKAFCQIWTEEERAKICLSSPPKKEWPLIHFLLFALFTL